MQIPAPGLLVMRGRWQQSICRSPGSCCKAAVRRGAVLTRPAAASALGSFGGGGGWGHVPAPWCLGPVAPLGSCCCLLTAKPNASASLLCQPRELQLLPAGVWSKPFCSLKRCVFTLKKLHVSLSMKLSRAPNIAIDSWKYSELGNAKRRRAWG